MKRVKCSILSSILGLKSSLWRICEPLVVRSSIYFAMFAGWEMPEDIVGSKVVKSPNGSPGS